MAGASTHMHGSCMPFLLVSRTLSLAFASLMRWSSTASFVCFGRVRIPKIFSGTSLAGAFTCRMQRGVRGLEERRESMHTCIGCASPCMLGSSVSPSPGPCRGSLCGRYGRSAGGRPRSGSRLHRPGKSRIRRRAGLTQIACNRQPLPSHVVCPPRLNVCAREATGGGIR